MEPAVALAGVAALAIAASVMAIRLYDIHKRLSELERRSPWPHYQAPSAMIDPGAGQAPFPAEPEKEVMDAYAGSQMVRKTADDDWVEEEIRYPKWE